MSRLAERGDHVSVEFADAYRHTKPTFLWEQRGPWPVWYPKGCTMAETGPQRDVAACWSQERLHPSYSLPFNQPSRNKPAWILSWKLDASVPIQPWINLSPALCKTFDLKRLRWATVGKPSARVVSRNVVEGQGSPTTKVETIQGHSGSSENQQHQDQKQRAMFGLLMRGWGVLCHMFESSLHFCRSKMDEVRKCTRTV